MGIMRSDIHWSNHYHIGTEMTYVEAMFMASNGYYHLNLSEETRKLISIMGLDAARAILLRLLSHRDGMNYRVVDS